MVATVIVIASIIALAIKRAEGPAGAFLRVMVSVFAFMTFWMAMIMVGCWMVFNGR